MRSKWHLMLIRHIDMICLITVSFLYCFSDSFFFLWKKSKA